MDELWINNSIELCGSVAGRPAYSHNSRGEDYYVFPMETERLSGATDKLNVLARSSLLNELEPETGLRMSVTGELRSFNNKNGVGSKLIISVFARSLTFTDDADKNIVKLTGAICKTPNFRKTPLGRDICDLMLAVSRRYGRSDYLPCIVWGRSAAEAAQWPVGSTVQLSGRLQSRQYIKSSADSTTVKTAFEISASNIIIL